LEGVEAKDTVRVSGGADRLKRSAVKVEDVVGVNESGIEDGATLT